VSAVATSEFVPRIVFCGIKTQPLKQTFLAVLSLCLSLIGFSQSYWQQEVNYDIDVLLNDKKNTLNGRLSLEYINHSPDTLNFIWFHLWPNAYKNKTTAYARQILKDKDGNSRWKKMKDKGSIQGISFSVDGQSAQLQPDPLNIDVIKLVLPKALLPGAKAAISTPFEVNIPTYSSRSGHIGNSYMICQWYPKPAVYDRKGWHPMPYLDKGEFYSEFGSFDVTITLPSGYVVGATGILQNSDELGKYKEIGKANETGKAKYMRYSPAGNGMKSLQYKAENVHDFAWFADKNFIIRYDTARMTSGNTIDVFTYSYENGNANWKNSIGFVEDAVRKYSRWIGEYPYPVVQAVEGPKNAMSGGMEYPMITLITSPNADATYLDGVITHEVGHNWFYGILASNERDHAWMDEGINTYYQFRYEAEKYKGNGAFGNAIPEDVKTLPLKDFSRAIYNAMSEIPSTEAIETTSAAFPSQEEYGTVVYLKTAVWMYIIESSIGTENLDKAIQAYYNEWKFKHPYPEDMKASFEKTLNLNMTRIFELLNKKGKFE
jgi:hypothetical protein